MTDTTIEWRATNLVALGEELRDKIARVTRQFEQRASTARGQDEMGRLRARLSQIVESIQTSYRTHLERMSEDEQTRDETLYDQTLAGIDMHRLVFPAATDARSPSFLQMRSFPRRSIVYWPS